MSWAWAVLPSPPLSLALLRVCASAFLQLLLTRAAWRWICLTSSLCLTSSGCAVLNVCFPARSHSLLLSSRHGRLQFNRWKRGCTPQALISRLSEMGPPRGKLQWHYQSPFWIKDITACGCGKYCVGLRKTSLLLQTVVHPPGRAGDVIDFCLPTCEMQGDGRAMKCRVWCGAGDVTSSPTHSTGHKTCLSRSKPEGPFFPVVHSEQASLHQVLINKSMPDSPWHVCLQFNNKAATGQEWGRAELVGHCSLQASLYPGQRQLLSSPSWPRR